MGTLISGIGGIGGIGGKTGTIGKLSVVANVEGGAGVPTGGAGGGVGAAGTAGKTPGALIVGVGATNGADNTCTGGAVGTVNAGLFTELTPIVCGVTTGNVTPLSDALFLAFCALAAIAAPIINTIKISFFICLYFCGRCI